jgi:hypothetical protein
MVYAVAMRNLCLLLFCVISAPANADIRATYGATPGERVIVDVKDSKTMKIMSDDPQATGYILFTNGITYTVETKKGREAVYRDDIFLDAERLVAKKLVERGYYTDKKLTRELLSVTELSPDKVGKWDSRHFDVAMKVKGRDVRFRYAASSAPELTLVAEAFRNFQKRELDVEARSLQGGIFWDSSEIMAQDMAKAKLSNGFMMLANAGAPTYWWGSDAALQKVDDIATGPNHYAVPPYEVTPMQLADVMIAAMDSPAIKAKLKASTKKPGN